LDDLLLATALAGVAIERTDMSETAGLSIVIVNWNTSMLLEQCLASIYANPPACAFDVWVVDNASSDDSVEMVRRQFPEVRLVTNSKNVGFAAANNQAIRESCASYIVVLNPDTVVHWDALVTLTEFMDRHPAAGAAGPRLLTEEGTVQFDSCYPLPTLTREFWFLFHLDRLGLYSYYDLDHWSIGDSRQVGGLSGACMILRRQALEEVGLLDEGYFIYTEEVDLCHRLGKSGWRVFWVPQAIITHLRGRSTRQVPHSMFLQLYRSKVRYFRKNHGRPAAIAYKLILLFVALSRIALGWLSRRPVPAGPRQEQGLATQYRSLLLALPAL
jgi:GT2 family glycosyltransferase